MRQKRQKRVRMDREGKMNFVLEPLQGKERAAMAELLSTIPTASLQEAYNKFIDRVKKV